MDTKRRNVTGVGRDYHRPLVPTRTAGGFRVVPIGFVLREIGTTFLGKGAENKGSLELV